MPALWRSCRENKTILLADVILEAPHSLPLSVLLGISSYVGLLGSGMRLLTMRDREVRDPLGSLLLHQLPTVRGTAGPPRDITVLV